MMPARDEYSAEWFAKAGQDLARVQRRLDEEDIEDAAFHLQQALEKALKGYLIGRGWSLRKIHDLEALLDDAIGYEAKLEEFRPLCQEATGYYLVERYPALTEGPSRAELDKALQRATTLVRLLQR